MVKRDGKQLTKSSYKMKRTNVLIIGSGGREHALAWKIKRSAKIEDIYVAPGNPGTAMLGCKNIPLSPVRENFITLADMAEHLDIGLVIVGPDNALAEGIVGFFKNRHIPVFGPEDSWFIESSKWQAKQLMRKVGIPTADFEIFDDPDKAIDYVRHKKGDVVVKADGLALGKGVFPCTYDVAKAEEAIRDLMIKKTLGAAGETVVIEDRLEGPELSIHALCDGEHVTLFPAVRDHKRLLDGDTGPMTGGMGVCGPIAVDPALMETIEKKIVLPCIKELYWRGSPFVGCLYPGIMLTKEGPKVLEFNARFGDPETQAYMRLLEDDVDFFEVLLACTQARLNQVKIRWKKQKCVCITLAAEGYPGVSRKGNPIELGRYHDQEDTGGGIVFQCGTLADKGHLVTNGGRVLSFTALLNDEKEALDWPCKAINRHIRFEGMQHRTDIGKVW
jgi:phosphoribosylamine--glycine ligase